MAMNDIYHGCGTDSPRLFPDVVQLLIYCIGHQRTTDLVISQCVPSQHQKIL